jgi:DNA polymerase-3 subunit beta
MKFIVASNTLTGALLSVNGVLSTKNTLPILDNYLFEVKGNKLKVIASDIETTMEAEVELSMVEGEGSIAIPARITLDTLRTLPKTPVTFDINLDTKLIEISTDTGTFKNVGFDAEEFPKVAEITDSKSLTMPSAFLARALGKTHFATGSDEMRPVMMGVNFEFTPKGIIFVGTDAHKLVRYIYKGVKTEDEDSFILPKKPMNLLRSTLSGIENEDVEIVYNQKNVRFSVGNLTMTSRLVNGKYPNYEAVIPVNNPNILIVDRTNFLNTLRRVSIYANQSTLQVRLSISGNSMEMSAEDIDYANAGVERLTVNYTGEDLEIGFNSKFLIEMLQNMDSEQVQIEMSTPGRAGILVPYDVNDEEEDILMLVMPIMLGQ